jgi:predicted HNH restriction endonuclease
MKNTKQAHDEVVAIATEFGDAIVTYASSDVYGNPSGRFTVSFSKWDHKTPDGWKRARAAKKSLRDAGWIVGKITWHDSRGYCGMGSGDLRAAFTAKRKDYK